jgi:hypothetical protein
MSLLCTKLSGNRPACAMEMRLQGVDLAQPLAVSRAGPMAGSARRRNSKSTQRTHPHPNTPTHAEHTLIHVHSDTSPLRVCLWTGNTKNTHGTGTHAPHQCHARHQEMPLCHKQIGYMPQSADTASKHNQALRAQHRPSGVNMFPEHSALFLQHWPSRKHTCRHVCTL